MTCNVILHISSYIYTVKILLIYLETCIHLDFCKLGESFSNNYLVLCGIKDLSASAVNYEEKKGGRRNMRAHTLSSVC